MKKGFTMIELIFVIVILGVLAAVAIPKLNATRDDAEQAKAMTNLATLMGDLTSYYTAQGSFADKINSMTNVPLTEQDGETNKGKFDYMIKNERCLTFQTVGAALVVTPNTGAQQKVCQNVLTNKSTQNTIRGTYTCATALTGADDNKLTPADNADANDTAVGFEAECKTGKKDTNGLPSTIVENATYHNTITTALGQDANGADAKGVITKFAPVVMSFEGAGVAF